MRGMSKLLPPQFRPPPQFGPPPQPRLLLLLQGIQLLLLLLFQGIQLLLLPPQPLLFPPGHHEEADADVLIARLLPRASAVANARVDNFFM
jgi:hypothetical protein